MKNLKYFMDMYKYSVFYLLYKVYNFMKCVILLMVEFYFFFLGFVFGGLGFIIFEFKLNKCYINNVDFFL